MSETKHTPEIVLTEVADEYKFTAQVCRFFDGDQVYLREMHSDGSGSLVTLNKDEFAKVAALAVEHGFDSALSADLTTLRAEREALQREKAAAMGLVEGHALTIAKLEAEAERLRGALKQARKRFMDLADSGEGEYAVKTGCAIGRDLIADALRPLDTPKCETCKGKGRVTSADVPEYKALCFSRPCPDCRPRETTP